MAVNPETMKISGWKRMRSEETLTVNGFSCCQEFERPMFILEVSYEVPRPLAWRIGQFDQ